MIAALMPRSEKVRVKVIITFTMAISPKSRGLRTRERISNCNICNPVKVIVPILVHLIPATAFFLRFNLLLNCKIVKISVSI